MKLNIKNGVGGIITSTITSGAIMGGGTYGYINAKWAKSLGLPLAHYLDGNVFYLAKDKEILKRAVIQTASQFAYGMLRSYPRYLKYWEQQDRKKQLEKFSTTSIRNKNSSYHLLIKDQKDAAEKKEKKDFIVGNFVKDFLELSVDPESSYYDNKQGKVIQVDPNQFSPFVDLQPIVQVSSKNNILLTNVQGRDYSRKEYISGGDLEITINGKITSRFPEVYPEAEVAKFIRLMQYKGILNCDNTILRQFNITRLIVLSYALTPLEGCRNVQPYSISCVAVEPTDDVQEKFWWDENIERENMIKANDWIKVVKFGSNILDPSTLLKLTQKW